MRTVNKQRAVWLLLLLLLTQAMCVQFSRSALFLFILSLFLSFAPAAYLMTIEIFSSCFFFRHCVAYLCLSTTDCSSRHNVATHSLALSHTHTLAKLALAHVAVLLFILHLRESEQKRERERAGAALSRCYFLSLATASFLLLPRRRRCRRRRRDWTASHFYGKTFALPLPLLLSLPMFS